ncbi:diguanylate cyclase [Ancylothrix sp. C2]|uniref:sensor domain-containing diguanylate cyclase n=1 Tax=Ancylothrix sp. D3o TaxID=2953691 RepID=UPI0021BB7431|nr:diguanylate cyclase [Ancylothrix sp. D3o]MCT7951517.1 diguanylate cyclase [Ancylothrix sp. D3o]
MNEEINTVNNKLEILDQIPVGACVLREDLSVVFWNKCLEEWTKISKNQIIGSNICEHYPHLNSPKYLSRLKQVFEGGPPTIFSSQLHKHIIPSTLPNEKLRIQHTTVTAIRRFNDSGFYALLIIEDVTDLTNRIQDYRKMRDRALAEIEERKQAEQDLYEKTKELEQRNFELTRLSQMSELLQACLTVEEAYTVVANAAESLFPNLSGGLFLLNQEKKIVEAVASWGNLLITKMVFPANQCWAVQRGKPMVIFNTEPCAVCSHFNKTSAQYCCIPLLAQGEILGMLYLVSHASGVLTQAKQLLALTVTEHISLSLANLKLRETLQNQSIRDPLTGLYNRRYMEEFLSQELLRAFRAKKPLSIIMLDVDNFKIFNDTFGHEAGDLVLQELGIFLKKNIRGSDIACRYGGEELTLILPDAPLEVARQRAEHLRQSVKHLNVKQRGQFLGSITLSLGVACFPEHGANSSAVLGSADAALYRAKKEGRDKVVVFSGTNTPIPPPGMLK